MLGQLYGEGVRAADAELHGQSNHNQARRNEHHHRDWRKPAEPAFDLHLLGFGRDGERHGHFGHLLFDGRTHRLGPHDALAFPGAAETSCRVPSGPTRDLNLMTRIGRAEGTLRAVAVAGRHHAPVAADEALLLVALTPGLSLDAPEDPAGAASAPVPAAGRALGALDSVLSRGPGTVRLSGDGTAAEIRVRVRG